MNVAWLFQAQGAREEPERGKSICAAHYTSWLSSTTVGWVQKGGQEREEEGGRNKGGTFQRLLDRQDEVMSMV